MKLKYLSDTRYIDDETKLIYRKIGNKIYYNDENQLMWIEGKEKPFFAENKAKYYEKELKEYEAGILRGRKIREEREKAKNKS